MKVAILAAIIAGTVTSAQGFTTLCRSYSDGVFSFIECADGTYIVIGPGGERRVFRPLCVGPTWEGGHRAARSLAPRARK